jgi:uncharacterized delta-60 repeat protein
MPIRDTDARTRLTVTPLEDRWTPAAGDLVKAFGDGGTFQFPVETITGGTVTTIASHVASMPDGRLVLAGYSQASMTDLSVPRPSTLVRVARLTPNGQLDTTFDGDGIAEFPLQLAKALTLQPDGSILLASSDQKGISAVRITSTGKLDVTFGTGGIAEFPIENGEVKAITLRPDGRILVAGSVGLGEVPISAGGRTGPREFAVFQFTADGRPDTSFSGDGLATVSFTVGSLNTARANALAVQPDGRLVVVGDSLTFSGITQSFRGFSSTYGLYQMAITRLNQDGTLDTSFGVGGLNQIRFGPSKEQTDVAFAVGVREDGRITVAGSAYERNNGFAGAVTVFTQDGRLDTNYDGDGLVTFANVGTQVAQVFPDGGVQFLTAEGLARLNASGQPDTTFAAGGKSLFNFTKSNYEVMLNVNRTDGTTAILNNNSTVKIARGTATTLFAPSTPGTIQIGGTPNGVATTLLPNAGQYAEIGELAPFRNFTGAARTATADVTGDGVLDFVVGPGPGGGPNVVVYDGKTGAKVADLNAFETSFTGGVFVAAADLNGDGKAEVVVTPDQGGGPVVVIYDGARLASGQNEAAQLTRFLGIEDANFRGGARASAGDTNGDGTADLQVAAGFGGGPRVAVYDGLGLFNRAGSQLPRKLMGDFFVFEDTLRNGVFVTSGDLNGDGTAEVIVGGGPGGGPRVMALDGKSLLRGIQSQVANFFAGDTNSRGGIRVAVRPGADGKMRLITGSGEGQPARVGVYNTVGVRTGTAEQELTPFNGETLLNGVFVG